MLLLIRICASNPKTRQTSRVLNICHVHAFASINAMNAHTLAKQELLCMRMAGAVHASDNPASHKATGLTQYVMSLATTVGHDGGPLPPTPPPAMHMSVGWGAYTVLCDLCFACEPGAIHPSIHPSIHTVTHHVHQKPWPTAGSCTSLSAGALCRLR
jgi:hypothetical protein